MPRNTDAPRLRPRHFFRHDAPGREQMRRFAMQALHRASRRAYGDVTDEKALTHARARHPRPAVQDAAS
jgi:hypothetical protein